MGYKAKVQLLKQIYKEDPQRKNRIKLSIDLFKWGVLRRGGVSYFNLLKLNKKENDIDEFITIQDYLKIHDELNPAYYRPILEDKIIFDRYVASFNLATPELLGIIENGRILWMENNSWKSLDSILDKSFSAYCKLVTSFGGKNIMKLDVHDGQLLINNEPGSIEQLKLDVRSGKYILQRTVIQHKTLSQLNPSCVNTVRIYTISKGNQYEVYSAALRMGVDNSIVDNVSSNNIVTGVNKDGTLQKLAHSGFSPPVWHSEHPNSKVVFENFRIPFYKEACELCCHAHQLIGNFFYIAWDIAITENGPVFIEGNPAADLLGPQVLLGGQKRRFYKYVDQYRTASGITN